MGITGSSIRDIYVTTVAENGPLLRNSCRIVDKGLSKSELV